MADDTWEQMVEDIDESSAESYDDMDSDSLFFELAEEDESFPEAPVDGRSRLRQQQRPVPSYARPGGRYAGLVRGRGEGLVRTPQGTAKVQLPGKFPTVEEFQKTVDALQRDIKKNADGIRQLNQAQRTDLAQVKALMAQSERKMQKEMKKALIISVVSANLPLIFRVLQERTETSTT